MAASNGLIGFGTTLLKGNADGPPETFTALGVEVTNLSAPNMSRNAVDVTHSASPSSTREFIAGLIDSGEFSVDINFIPATSDVVITAIQAARATWQILFPNDIAWTFEAFCTGYNPTAPLDDKMTASVTFKISGLPTISDES